MPDCIKCGSYTRYNGGLCGDCYSNNNTMVLTNKEYYSSENMIKGRIAETLIEEMFLKLKFKVFKFGMEHTIPGIMDLLRGANDDVAMKLRRMPDFVIHHPDTKKVYFVEVKFRASGNFKFADFGKDFPDGYDNAFVIIVSKKHIKCLTVQELRNGAEISPESRNLLGYRPEFMAYRDVIIDYCGFALQFFENVK